MSKRDEWRTISRSKLKTLYKKHSMPAIAAMFGVTTGAVAYRLRFFSLTSKDSGIRHTSGPRKSFLPPKEELAELYSKMSMRDVAAHYRVGETAVFHRLRDYGIPIQSRSERLTGKTKSLEHRLSMSRSRIGLWVGDKNFNWKGGITSKNKLARSKTAYFEWKNAVLKAAEFRCESCGIEHGSICRCCGHRVMLHAHHLKGFAEFPKLRYRPSNGKALCVRCHQTEHDKQIG